MQWKIGLLHKNQRSTQQLIVPWLPAPPQLVVSAGGEGAKGSTKRLALYGWLGSMNRSQQERRDVPKTRPRVLLGSLHNSDGWEAQWGRVERWYKRMTTAKNKPDVLDFTFAFFQACAALPEWFELTGAVTREEVGAFVDDHVELGICQDVSNVTKHCSLTRKGHQDSELSIIREYSPPNNLHFRPGYYGGDARLTIVADKRTYDVRELADTCIETWRTYLTTVRGRAILEAADKNDG